MSAPAANWWVMVGYMLLGLGSLFLSSRFLPDPVQRRGAGLVFVGTLFGALLGAVLGTFIGAIIGEMTSEQATIKGSMKPAIGASIGRIIGTTSKVALAIAVWLMLSIAAFWP